MSPPVGRPRILFVTPASPYSLASGSEQRSALMLRALRRLGAVDVLVLQPGGDTQVTSVQEQGETCVQATLAGADWTLSRYHPKPAFTVRVEQALGCPLGSYALVVGRYVWPVCQLAIPDTVPALVDLDDFRSRYAAQARWSLALLKQRATKAVAYRMARRQLSRFQGGFTLSEQDQAELAGAGLPVALLPNVPATLPASVEPVPANQRILFVGSLWYLPNTQAVDWFLQQAWPAVRAAQPAASLVLVGNAPAACRARWLTYPGVSMPGFVPDIADAYREAQLVIAPIHSGGGTNIKVLEAMAHGRPCLVSGFVARAFGQQLQAGRDFWVADGALAFSQACVQALAQPELLRQLAAQGKQAVDQAFTLAAFERQLLDFAAPFLPTPPAPGGA